MFAVNYKRFCVGSEICVHQCYYLRIYIALCAVLTLEQIYWFPHWDGASHKAENSRYCSSDFPTRPPIFTLIHNERRKSSLGNSVANKLGPGDCDVLVSQVMSPGSNYTVVETASVCC